MYQFTKNSEYLFFKILTYDSLLNFTSNNLFRDYLKTSSYSIMRNPNGNLLVKKIYNLTNLYITYIRTNIWEIKYISNSGFLFLNKNLNLKRKYLLYKKIFIYNKKGNIIPGVLIPNKRKNRNLRNLKIKIDIGTQDLKEVYSLGINLGDKVGFQEDFSIFNKKYLLSNEITNKIGLFILWEIRNYFKTNRNFLNFLLRKYNITKLYLMNYLVKLSVLINNTLKLIDIFLKTTLGREVISFCQRNNINIKILTKNKLTYYIINVNIKYFQSPIEMILKSEIEKIINLIIFVVILNDHVQNV
ncbi:hypothetical protein [Candidatus Karelsulcia muelleri]